MSACCVKRAVTSFSHCLNEYLGRDLSRDLLRSTIQLYKHFPGRLITAHVLMFVCHRAWELKTASILICLWLNLLPATKALSWNQSKSALWLVWYYRHISSGRFGGCLCRPTCLFVLLVNLTPSASKMRKFMSPHQTARHKQQTSNYDSWSTFWENVQETALKCITNSTLSIGGEAHYGTIIFHKFIILHIAADTDLYLLAKHAQLFITDLRSPERKQNRYPIDVFSVHLEQSSGGCITAQRPSDQILQRIWHLCSTSCYHNCFIIWIWYPLCTSSPPTSSLS